MTDIQYHSAMSSVGSTNTIDEFFSCDEEDSDSRSSSRTKSVGMNPDHIEIEIDEDSTNTTNTTQIITTRATSVNSDRTIEPDCTSTTGTETNSIPINHEIQFKGSITSRQRHLSETRSRNSSCDSGRMGGQYRTNSLRKISRVRKRPSNLPLSNICSPVPDDLEPIEPYDEFLVKLNEDLEETSEGITNHIVIPNTKSRLVSFDGLERPVIGQDEVESSKVCVNLASNENVSAIDVFLTPLSLTSTENALEEIQNVCRRLHYSTISTILLAKVIKEKYVEENKENFQILGFG